jgi:hypothetical protein
MSTAIAEEKSRNQLNQHRAAEEIDESRRDTVISNQLRFQTARRDHQSKPHYAATQNRNMSNALDEVVPIEKIRLASRAIEDIIEHLLVKFGCEMLKIVPGHSTNGRAARLISRFGPQPDS